MVAVYAAVGLAWIVGSGVILDALALPTELGNAVELVKGAGFVTATALALYTVLRLRSTALDRVREDLQIRGDQLAETAGLLRAIVDAAPLPICTLDAAGRVHSWNPAAARVTGWSAVEALDTALPLFTADGSISAAAGDDATTGYLAADAMPAHGATPVTGPDEAASDLLDRIVSGETIDGLQAHARRRDGASLTLRLWTAPLHDHHGNAAGTLLICEDVTVQTEVDEERRRLAQAVEQAAEAIIITDLSASIRYVNPAFERVSGYSRSELIGRNPRILQSGQQDGEFYRRLWSTITAGQIWTGTLINRRRDGSLYEETAVISPIRDERGEIVSYVAVKRDVTHEHALERQLAEAQRMEAAGQLAGGIAHDFNNLLTAISGYAQLLRDELPSDDPRSQDAEQIVRASDSATGLVRQLLAFSRRSVLQPRVMRLELLLEELRPMLGRLVGAPIDLEIKVGHGIGQSSPMPASSSR